MAAPARRRLLYAAAATGAAVLLGLILCLRHSPATEPDTGDNDRAVSRPAPTTRGRLD